MATIREWIGVNGGKYPAQEDLIKAACAELGVTRDNVVRILRKGREGVAKEKTVRSDSPSKATKRTRSLAISETDFMQMYDPTTKTRYALDEVLRLIEPGSFIRDHILRKESGCGDPSLWRDIARDPDEPYWKYQFRMGEDVWWTDPDTAERVCQTNKKARRVCELKQKE